MSTPIVSGTAALLWESTPTLTAQQVFRGVVANGVSSVLSLSSAAAAANTPNVFVQVSQGAGSAVVVPNSLSVACQHPADL